MSQIGPLLWKFPGGVFFRIALVPNKEACSISANLNKLSQWHLKPQYPKKSCQNYILTHIQEIKMAIRFRSKW